MPRKYPPLKPREIEEILIKRGFVFSHWRGSHKYFAGEWAGSKRLVTVDFHYEVTNDPRLIKSIIRQSGMTREEFYGSIDSTAKKIGLRKTGE